MTAVDSTTRFDPWIRMTSSGAWLPGLPRWITSPATQGASGPSLGPRERLLLVFAIVVIVVWGFSGFEYPQLEVSKQPGRPGATLAAVDPANVALAGDPGPGAELFQANGCYACHSLEGDTIIGPSLSGIFGTTVELDDGTSVLVDDAYLVESILWPDAKRVAGFDDAAMPSYEGLVTDADAAELAEYIKGLR